jgi:DNA modification methylase
MKKLKIEYRPIGEIIPYENNSRTHSAEQVKQIEKSMLEFDVYNPILIDENNIIIAGHGRLEAAKNLGMAELPTIVLAGLTEAQRRALTIADNSIALNSGWDEEKLAEELAFLQDEDFDIDITALDAAYIDGLLHDIDGGDADSAAQDENIPEPPETPVSRLGDIWICGKHKVLCGDSTKRDDYEKLFGAEELADMCFTDPPYNVDYGKTEEVRARGKGKTIKGRELLNDNLGEEFGKFLFELSATALEFTKGALYICMAGSEMHNLYRAFEEAGGYISTQIIWAKNHYSLGWSDYHKQHEPILYGWRKGNDHYWCGARDQGDVWHINRPHLQTLHPTMKPVELVERAIRNSSKTQDIVLDPFGGSGTTMIAAENLNRYARLIELDPKYVDVIVTRWQETTGKTAVHAETGKTFGE